MSILSHLDLKGAQQTAAERLEAHLAVTAGAGAGKTRTLVGRYLHWVENGVSVRALVAITFTEKAAREMRARIRNEIENRLAAAGEPATAGWPAAPWESAYIELDSAPIGTIHALCADLLRLYPAEAGVDPRFEVIEEGRAAMLRAQAIEAALAWAATDAAAGALFADFEENVLRQMLAALVNRRLEAAPAARRPDPLADWEAALRQWLDAALGRPEWLSALTTLAGLASTNPDDRMEAARVAVLGHWQAAQQARAAGEWDSVLAAAASLRGATSIQGQQKNWPQDTLAIMREAMTRLRELYAEGLGALIPKDGATWKLDRAAAERLPAVARVFERALAEYEGLKQAALGLDFDDLEGKAAQLLAAGLGPGPNQRPRALLVDEFQDTNARQRQIVYALAGLDPAASGAAPANLFIVGDAKQSIYGFRGADVTVFREIQSDLERLGGQHLDLSLTFRAHGPLLALSARLLRPLMGEADDPTRPYTVPFAPLTAHRPQPRAGVAAPFVEFQIGLGDAADGRRIAAAALALRLRQLEADKSFRWDEMALLFRASLAFPVYEDALEAAGIPYVTVAGAGFYDRPEIRDLLNALSAIADPSDDLALAGLLRSPAFALGDADLYRLRFPHGGDQPSALYPALLADARFAAAAQTLAHLNALSGRLPIAELLKDFIDQTHYRAILKAGGGQRLSRNVDKLLADAHRSRLAAVGDFLDYVRTLRDIGAREGEAPAEVGGAVQLMTIHKAKGLEFPLVVLADASHAGGGRGGESMALDPVLGLLLKLTAEKAQPIAWQLGRLARADREAAEDRRLLYVALTRAQEKIIVNGHANRGAAKDGPAHLKLTGWLDGLGQVIGLDSAPIAEAVDAPQRLALAPGWEDTNATLYPLRMAPMPPAAAAAAPELTAAPGPLAAPLAPSAKPDGAAAELESQRRVWRVISGGRAAPAWIVGGLVHEALRLELLHLDAAALEARLRPLAWEMGLTEAATIHTALRETRQLLERLRAHPLFAEVESAAERLHAVPCQLGHETGIIDLLYRLPAGWVLADFRTDELRDDAALARVLPDYQRALARYAGALMGQLQLSAPPRAMLVFLNLKGAVQVVE